MSQKIIVNRLFNYFERHPSQSFFFNYKGKSDPTSCHHCYLFTEFFNFTLAITDEEKFESSIILCHFDIHNINLIIDESPNAQLLVLDTKRCPKLTPIYANIELTNFRMFFESQNTTVFYRNQPSVQTIISISTLESPEILSQLQHDSRAVSRINKKCNVSLVSMPAHMLLTHKRFDIAIKCVYGKLFSRQLAPDWRNRLYYEQALRITGPGPQITEYDGTGKSGLETFLNVFHSLLKIIPPEKIHAVPVSSDNTAINGSHRIASAIVMKRNIYTAKITADTNCISDSSFFLGSSHGHLPCPKDIIDEAAIEYCRIKKELNIIILFPPTISKNYACDELSKIGNIVYQKDIMITANEASPFLQQLYLGHPWLGGQISSQGFTNKIRGCFPHPGKMRVILLDNCKPSQLRPCKDQIREYYKIGNHSIHITDGEDELIRVSGVVFNQNSLELLKLGISPSSSLLSLLFTFRDWLESHQLDNELFCVGGSAILSLLNLRECRDLDILYAGNINELPKTPKGIDFHNHQEKYYPFAISTLLGDPNLYCWYMGIKFCNPEIIYSMKVSRGEPKDKIDASLLNTKLPTQLPIWLNKINVKFLTVNHYAQGKIYRILSKTKHFIVKTLRNFK